MISLMDSYFNSYLKDKYGNPLYVGDVVEDGSYVYQILQMNEKEMTYAFRPLEDAHRGWHIQTVLIKDCYSSELEKR